MATLQITFVSESAGYQNTLGWYNKRTGEAGIVFRNTNDDGPHAAISAGAAATVDVAQSDIDSGNVGFFVIANGAAIYGTGSSSVLAGPLSFSTKPNGDGVIRDAAGHKLTGEQGELIFTDKALNKNNVDYTSNGGTNAAAINADQADGITGRIAFEDLVKNSDRDFNDLVVDVRIAAPANHAPVVDDQAFSIAENSAAGAPVGQVVASDPDAGQSLSYAIIDGNANGAFAINAATGAVTVADPSKLDFESPSLNGYALTVKVTDSGTGALADTAVVAISVTNVNEAPVAVNDSLALDATEDIALVVPAASLLANDTDPDAGASISIIAVGDAAHGAVSLNGDGDVVFIPAGDYSGPASFSYTMSDGALTSTATVSLNVAAAADAPTLVVADASSTGDAAIALSVAAALGDLDGSESLAIEISGVPAGWALSAGTVDPDTGTYLLTASDLGGLTLTPPPGTIDSIALTITARATEASNSDSASSSGILTVSVANGTPGNDVLVGGPGDDVIDALAGNDLIIGLGGNDQLFGSEGNDTLRGGAGDDLLDGGVLADFQSQAGFTDTDTADYSTAGSAVSVNLAAGTAADGDGGTDTLTGIERVVGSAFDDVLTGSEAFFERYVGGAGDDTIDGGLYNDRAEYANATAGITVNMTALGAGSGTVTGNASVGTDTLIGVEQIVGTSFADSYTALGYLSPSSPGGVMSNFNEFEGRGGNDTITGNGGTRLSFQGALEAVNVNLATGIAVGGASVGTDTFTGVNMVRASAFADTLTGGLAANNNFESFEGQGGNDTISGGAGFDRADYAFDGAVSTGITVNLAAGTVSGDPVLTGTDTLQSVESVRGSFRDDSYDAAGFSGFSANAGSNGTFNEFEGLAGNDVITGNGNTRLSYVSAREAVDVNLGSGIATGGASVGTDTFSGVGTVRGSNFNDTLVGSNNGVATAEIFEARAGNDTIDGGGGFDQSSYASDPATAGIAVNMASINAFTGTVVGDATIGTDTLVNVVSVRGTGFADTYVATGYNSAASGLGTFNEFEGGGGNDSITGNGNTRLTFVNAGSGVSVNLGAGTASGASTGTDTFTGVNAVRGSNFSDLMIGSGNAETFEGRGGNDTIDGLGGFDLVRYERDPTGPGTFQFNAAGVVTATVVNQGVDTLSNIEAIRATNFADTLDASAYGGGIQFEALNGDDSMAGGGGNDTLDGGAGTDVVSYASATAGVTVDLAAGTASDGMGGTDTLISIENAIGSAFNDTLSGSAGDNQLEGGTGNDTLAGRAGNDILNGGVIADLQSYIGFTDSDAADYSAAAGAVNVNLATGVASDGDGGTDTLIGIERVVGSAYDDVLTGSGAFGEAYVGGAGNDTIDGGASFDRAEYGNATAGITVNMTALGSSSGTVIGDASVGTDTLIEVEQVIGTNYADVYIATGYLSPSAAGGINSNFNEFQGLGGNDTIIGNGGTRISYQNALEAVNVNLATGVTVGGASVGTDSFTGVNAVRGSAFADTLTGGLAANNNFEIFEGRGGDDLISGGSGFDVASYAFDGAASVGITVNLAAGTVVGDAVFTGTDTLLSVESVRGSYLSDSYNAIGFSNVSANAGSNGTFNEFEGNAGNDLITGNGNTRVAYSAAREAVIVNLGTGVATGGASVGTDTFTGVNAARGSNFDDTLIGSNGNDVLLGGFGNDTLSGGDGNDTLQGDDGNDTIDGGAGYDVAQYNSASGGGSFSVGATGVITASAGGQGTDTLTNVESIVGTNFADFYNATAYAGVNEFEGLGGNDTVLGNGETRINFFRATSGVTVDLQAGTATGSSIGTDTLSNVDYVNGSSFNDTLSGSAGDDVIAANFGDDLLSGNAGNDLLDGGFGTDRASYANSTGAVSVDLAVGTASDGMGGTDTLFSIENVTGSSLNDTLIGSVGDNQLQGGDGADRLIGGAGNDVLDGGIIADFQSAAGFIDIDTADYSTATGAVNVNLATGTATDGQGGSDTLIGIERIVGSAFDDVLTGSGAFVERYLGGAGNDTIDGGLFNDRAEYTGATAGITVNLTAFGPAGGTVIGDASVGTDTLIGVEQVIGTSFADTYSALGYLSPSGPGGVISNFNEFEGAGGNDTITGNGGTRVSYAAALESVSVNLLTGLAVGGASVGTDSFTGVNQVRGSSFADTLTGGLAANNNFESFEGRGGNDVISGGAGFDRADYAFDAAVSTGITVNLAAGTVSGEAAVTGTDTLLSIESVRGSYLSDSYNAIGFSGASANAGSNGTFNEFEGMAGNDLITGNGNTRITYSSAREAVNVNLATGIATGGASVGTDSFTGVNAVRGSNFDDTLIGSSGNDTLLGGAGNDLLSGGNGNDVLESGDGVDMLTGGVGFDTLRSSGSGTDTFDYNLISEAGDTVEQFTSGAGGDVFDIADLLDASTNYADGAGGALADYVRVTASAANGLLQIDTDGLGAGGWQTLATILGGNALDLNALLAGGNIDYFN